MFDYGAAKVRMSGGAVSYYTEYTTTNLYVEKTFGGDINTLVIKNDDNSDAVQISYDGSTLEGNIKAGESLTLNTSTRSSVYIKGTAGGGNVRVWGW